MNMCRWILLFCVMTSCSWAANPSFQQFALDYFTTNGFVIRGMIGTNAVDGSITNRNQSQGIVSIAGTNAVIKVNNGTTGNLLIVGQSNGTNFFVMQTNGGIFMGRKESIDQHWGSFLGYETLVSIKDPSLGDNDRSEIEVGVYDSANNVRGSMNMLFQTNHADIQLYAAVNNSTNYRTSLWNVHKDQLEFIFKSNEPDPAHGHYLRFLPDKPASTVGPSYMFNTAVFQTNTATTSPLIAVRNFSTNKFIIMPDGRIDAVEEMRIPTITLTNNPTFQTTNAAPAGFSVGVTVPAAWFVFTNAGNRYLIPGYTP